MHLPRPNKGQLGRQAAPEGQKDPAGPWYPNCLLSAPDIFCHRVISDGRIVISSKRRAARRCITSVPGTNTHFKIAESGLGQDHEERNGFFIAPFFAIFGPRKTVAKR